MELLTESPELFYGLHINSSRHCKILYYIFLREHCRQASNEEYDKRNCSSDLGQRPCSTQPKGRENKGR